MCGRYNFNTDDGTEEIEKIVREVSERLKNEQESLRNYSTGEIFPTNTVPVLVLENGIPAIQLMKWGFPKWDGKGHIINSRSEDAAEKKTFAKSLRERRCVILSTGFYEWQKADKTLPKTKYLFNNPESRMLYMAGAYNTYKEDEREYFIIFTRESNKYINDVHNRMPVILFKNELRKWLLDGNSVKRFFTRDNVELTRQAV